MRDAYNRPLTDAEKKQLEVDPSYFAEIYIMKADGSGQRRLTNVAGYDGGPFFTHDGSRIVWRRFDETGIIADVWTMKPDGTDQRQITNFGAMSWAPYEHPSGKYFIFASNKLGFENFELFMVDVAGTKEPVRVTYSAGFDGLPVPSPDGKQLAWTSTRGGGSAGQIFLGAVESREGARSHRAGAAEEVRDQAMKHRTFLLAFALSAAAATHPPADATQLRTYVETLASERFGGRHDRHRGEALARQFIISELKRIGARPLPGRTDFRLPFEFTAGTRDGGSTVSAGARGLRGEPTRGRFPFPTTATSRRPSSSPATASSCPTARTSATTATPAST